MEEKELEKRFYEEKWFWLALTIIVICLTRSRKIIICGNGNGCYEK